MSLSLKADLLRTHRELFRAHTGADDPSLARGLVLKSDWLHAQSTELSKLTAEVRLRRDAVDAHDARAHSG